MRLILASASPRRRELLKEICPEFSVIPARGEERADFSLPPSEVVQALARHKAEEVALLPCAQGAVVLGADTVVALDGKILGKPVSEADAFRMLSALSGRTHEVFTGVALAADGKVRTEYARTEVTFRPLSEQFIRDYIATGSPMDKAGAYGIQDGGLAEKITGSYTNVVGLPVELCHRILNLPEETERTEEPKRATGGPSPEGPEPEKPEGQKGVRV